MHKNHIATHIIMQFHNWFHVYHSFMKEGKSKEKYIGIKIFPLPKHAKYTILWVKFLKVLQWSFHICPSSYLFLFSPKKYVLRKNSPNSLTNLFISDLIPQLETSNTTLTYPLIYQHALPISNFILIKILPTFSLFSILLFYSNK